ncbi:integrin alpha [Nitrosomonas sp. Nm166]|uniref:beta strand repeat-containing protein n=1 Tax=Nitrosomonas sp. Nm166 TaxID=1881054 RepID=UPI0008EC1270|nr:integrin alpha [Nitrosomonas sp. Nm166]SFE65077.1 FG-GAP repeat-containing protein [Nitrosomonas sp. Nm166]
MAIINMNLASLNGKNGFRVDGEVPFYIGLGDSVSNAGDVNGDGFDDVIIGAQAHRIAYASPYSGYSYVVFGKSSGFNPVVNLSNLNGNDGFRLDTGEPGDYFGASVSNAGDVNGDGFDDVIIGAPNADPNGFDSGSSYVVFGRASDFDAALNLSSLDGSNGFRLDGAATFDNAGYSVSTAGDVNGDGFDDLIVAAPSPAYSGFSYVVFGKASGFSAALNLSSLDGSNGFRLDGRVLDDDSSQLVSNAGDVNGDGFDDVIVAQQGSLNAVSSVIFGKASGFDATLDLFSLDGSNGFRLDGEANYGWSVSNAGDVNGDGFDDLIVGARSADPNGNLAAGSSYVMFGKASGFSATLNLSSLDGSNGFRLDGVAAYDQSGFSVSTAGDVNGDGFDDVIVGAPDADPNGDSSGSSYVVFGKASGFDATMNLSRLDSNSGVRLDGVAAFDYAGRSISSAGDVNGDGFDDLMVAAPGATTAAYPYTSVGSYIIFGSSQFTGTVTYSGTPGDDILTGTSAMEIFNAGDGNDLMIGGGGSDEFHADAGDDEIRVSDLDFVLVDGGSGKDILSLDGSGLNLDLTRASDKISGIEAIDLQGIGNNTLTLTAVDLLQLSDTTNTLEVNGNAGDRIIGLSSGWTYRGISDNFQIYTQGEAMLRVAMGVMTDFGGINLASLNGSNGFRLDGVAAEDFSGGSVSNAGDVNGDGFDDLIIGAFGADPNEDRSGSSYVVFGKASGFSATLDLSTLDGSNGFRLDGAARRDSSGDSVSNAGDVNGDGFDDVIIGARGADPNGGSSGASYVVFGKDSGFSATLNLSSLDGSNGFRLDGERGGDFSGDSVSNAGDVNGDGFDDVIVSASTYTDIDGNVYVTGSSYVVFGKATGFAATQNLSNLDGNNGFRLDGIVTDQSTGPVSSAGDVNGDGFDDVIVGVGSTSVPNFTNPVFNYVVFGKASGFDATLDLSSLDGSNGFRLDVPANDNFFSTSVSNAGDVNGDGFDDLIVGADGADLNGDYSGASYVVFGKASGFDATLDLSNLDGSNGFRLDGVAEFDSSGRSVSNAGDVNGDGFDDLIVGASGADPNGYNSGSSYVVFGKASGFSATLDLFSLNSDTGFRLDGVAAIDYSGQSVSSAGDVNGDGFDDLIVGATGADPNGDSSGSSYVVFGSRNIGKVILSGTPEADNLHGTSIAEIFEAGAGDDLMIGHGGADVFLGEAGDDYIRVSDLGFESVDGGIGNDTLALGGSDLNLNLTDMSGKISGIETINLFGTGDNTLTLTAADVLNLSDTTNTLKVNGNADDRIVGLSYGWGDGGVHGDFHTFFNDAAVLLVGVNVATDFV